MFSTYLKGLRTKTKTNFLLVLEQGQPITDDGAKGTEISMVITTLATTAERFNAALEKISLAIDEMDDDSARSSEELELEETFPCWEKQSSCSRTWRNCNPSCRRNGSAGTGWHRKQRGPSSIVGETDEPRPFSPCHSPSKTINECKASTLTIPTFNGGPLQWTPFWNGFFAAVDGNDRLAPVEKFAYVRGKLKGDALPAVAGLPLTNVNYPWQ